MFGAKLNCGCETSRSHMHFRACDPMYSVNDLIDFSQIVMNHSSNTRESWSLGKERAIKSSLFCH